MLYVDRKPFLKWVGGKRALLRELQARFPRRFNRYFEPFVGGGAAFFSMPDGTPAALSDANERLIRTYRAVRDKLERVIALLRHYELAYQGQASEDGRRAHFEYVRSSPQDHEADHQVAAWMIFLNRTGFNGLYRVNARGQFNVPHGRRSTRQQRFVICDEPVLRACSQALQTAALAVQDFRAVAQQVEPGDLVYLDPPYVPLTETSNFTSYTSDGFGPDDQQELVELVVAMKRAGVHVVVSNSSAARPLFAAHPELEIHEVRAPRRVSARVEGRGDVTELIVT